MQRTNPRSVFGDEKVNGIYRILHYEGGQQALNLSRFDAAAQLSLQRRQPGVTPSEALLNSQISDNLTISGIQDKPIRVFKQASVGKVARLKVRPELKAYLPPPGT